MRKIKIEDLPEDRKVSKAEMKKVMGGYGNDVNVLIQLVLKDSYTEGSSDLADYASKVDSLNQQKTSIRDSLGSLRDYSSKMG